MRYLVLFVAIVAGISLTGCGDKDPFNRQAVPGTVTMDGKPIPLGNIEFVPTEKQSTPLTLEIKDGKFSTSKKNGLSPGKYIVRIQGFDGPMPLSGDVPGETKGPLPKSIVPDKYGPRSTETTVIQDGDANELSFVLVK